MGGRGSGADVLLGGGVMCQKVLDTFGTWSTCYYIIHMQKTLFISLSCMLIFSGLYLGRRRTVVELWQEYPSEPPGIYPDLSMNWPLHISVVQARASQEKASTYEGIYGLLCLRRFSQNLTPVVKWKVLISHVNQPEEYHLHWVNNHRMSPL